MKGAAPTPAADRVRLAEAAVAGDPHLRVDDREVRRGGPTFTADTLAELARRGAGRRAVLPARRGRGGRSAAVGPGRGGVRVRDLRRRHTTGARGPARRGAARARSSTSRSRSSRCRPPSCGAGTVRGSRRATSSPTRSTRPSASSVCTAPRGRPVSDHGRSRPATIRPPAAERRRADTGPRRAGGRRGVPPGSAAAGPAAPASATGRPDRPRASAEGRSARRDPRRPHGPRRSRGALGRRCDEDRGTAPVRRGRRATASRARRRRARLRRWRSSLSSWPSRSPSWPSRSTSCDRARDAGRRRPAVRAPDAAPGDPQPVVTVVTPARAPTGTEAATIALLAVDRDSGEGTVLLVPPATIADVPGHGAFRLGEAFDFGGSGLVGVSLDNLLGRPQRRGRHRLRGRAGRRSLDRLGGVEVTLSRPAHRPRRRRQRDDPPAGRDRSASTGPGWRRC